MRRIHNIVVLKNNSDGWVVWLVHVWVESFRGTRASEMGKGPSASNIEILVLDSSLGTVIRNQGT